MASPTVQRSFRLSSRTAELIDGYAEASSETRNSLVERLLAEAIRTERHPLIRFRSSASGRREPMLIGTRLLVRQVAPLVQLEGGVEQVADSLAIPPRQVQACVSYYAEFTDEIDADIEWASRVERDEHQRWLREQAATT